MIEKAIRTAATVAALAILVCLMTPVATQAAAAPVRNQSAEVEAEQAASPAGLWQLLADFWDGLVASVFAGSEDEAEEGEYGQDPVSDPPEGGENNNNPADDGGDQGSGVDPNG